MRKNQIRAVMIALVAIALLPPSVKAQPKAGVVVLENHTGVQVHIDGDYYLDANGEKVPSTVRWTLAPGAKSKLPYLGQEIVAREFFFRITTADGQSRGWRMKVVNAAGELRAGLTVATLDQHNKLIGAVVTNDDKSTLQQKLGADRAEFQKKRDAERAERRNRLDAEIANADSAIRQGEQNLTDVNNRILVANGALLLANAALNDPSLSDGARFLAGIAVVTARRVLDDLNAERSRVEFNLRANRDRHSQLNNERLSLGQ